MAEVMYDGIVLPYCKTTEYSQNVVYENETDWVREDITLTVESYFTQNYIQLLFPRLIGINSTAADIMAVIRSRLLRPRRAFSVKCAGVEIIPTVSTSTGTVDVANGPMPQYCNVIQMNDANFIVVWSVKASYWENNALNLTGNPKARNRRGNPVLSCRWSESQSIDNCLYTTRTRTGRFTIRSDNAQGQIVDRFRDRFAIVAVPPGWLRQSADYKVDPSGLALEFTLIDKQQYKMPPRPAYEASGSYTEETLSNGAKRFGNVSVTLKGAATTDQGELILAALSIASAKLQTNGAKMSQIGAGGQNDPGRIGIMNYCNLTVDMYQNIVSVRMRAMMLPSRFFAKPADNPDRSKIWSIDIGSMAFTPFTDARKIETLSPRWIMRGSAGNPENRVLLQAAAYYDPSLLGTTVDQKTGQFTGNLPEVGQLGNRREP